MLRCRLPANPSHVPFAFSLELDKLLTLSLVLNLAKDRTVQAHRHADPILVPNQHPNLDRQLGLLAAYRAGAGEPLKAVPRTLTLGCKPQPQVVEFHKLRVRHVEHRLELAVLVGQPVDLRLHFLDACVARLRRPGRRRRACGRRVRRATVLGGSQPGTQKQVAECRQNQSGHTT